MTGLTVEQFNQLTKDVVPLLEEADRKRLSRPTRKREIGGGHPYELSRVDQVLLPLIWIRVFPTHEVLGYMFGVSKAVASRTIARALPLLDDPSGDRNRPIPKSARWISAMYLNRRRS